MAKPTNMPKPAAMKVAVEEVSEELAPTEDQEIESLDVDQTESEDDLLLDAKKPEIEAPKAVVKKKKSGPLKVRATRPGFIYNSRKVEGDVFTINSNEELGSWMEII